MTVKVGFFLRILVLITYTKEGDTVFFDQYNQKNEGRRTL